MSTTMTHTVTPTAMSVFTPRRRPVGAGVVVWIGETFEKGTAVVIDRDMALRVGLAVVVFARDFEPKAKEDAAA